MRRSRSELEAALARQVRLYDFAPVDYLTVDRATAVRELNLTAAGMLGSERDQLLGRALDAFLEPRTTVAGPGCRQDSPPAGRKNERARPG